VVGTSKGGASPSAVVSQMAEEREEVAVLALLAPTLLTGRGLLATVFAPRPEPRVPRLWVAWLLLRLGQQPPLPCDVLYCQLGCPVGVYTYPSASAYSSGASFRDCLYSG